MESVAFSNTNRYRVSDLEARAGFDPGDDFAVEASGIEQQIHLLRDSQQLQLHLRADLLLTVKLSWVNFFIDETHDMNLCIMKGWKKHCATESLGGSYRISFLNELNNIPRVHG